MFIVPAVVLTVREISKGLFCFLGLVPQRISLVPQRISLVSRGPFLGLCRP